MAELVIKNALVVTPQGAMLGGVAIQGEKISAVGRDLELPRGEQELDAQGLVLLPGLIDPHTHMGIGAARGQGRQKCEADFREVSVEAAVGGITSICTTALFGSVRESLLPCLRQAKEMGERGSLVDFRLTAFMIYPAHNAEIPRMLQEGIASFKYPLAYRGEEGRQIGIVSGVNWGFVYQGFETIAHHSPPALAMIHAEEPDIIEFIRDRLKGQGRQDIAAWSDSRPNICEAMHVLSAGLIAGELKTPLYVVHTSARESLEAARFLRQQGVQVSVETCPQYLFYTKHTAPGLLGKVNPPLREEADIGALWRGLADGTVDTMGSDHCCLLRRQKEGDLWEAMPGFPGFGGTLAILVSEGVNKGRLTWERLARVTAENTARLFHLYPKKGVIAPGSDADLVLVDPNREWVLDARSMRSASDFTIWDGVRVKGKAVKVFSRGRLLVDDGEVRAQAPWGKYIPPQ